MADLENLLLEAAGRTSASGSRSRMQTKRSYSDEPSYSKSSSEDEDSDDAGFASRKPSGSQIPLKKRFDAAEKDDERGSEDEGRIDDDDSGHDSDSDSVGSDLYKDDDYREKLSKLTELEREMILADRAESRDDILKKKKAGAWQTDKKSRPTKETAPPPRRRTTLSKPVRSEYKDALVELAARRKAQDTSNQRKKRDSGGSRYSPKRKAITSSPISDSPPGRGRGKGGSNISRDSEGSSSESEKASADDDSSGWLKVMMRNMPTRRLQHSMISKA